MFIIFLRHGCKTYLETRIDTSQGVLFKDLK